MSRYIKLLEPDSWPCDIVDCPFGIFHTKQGFFVKIADEGTLGGYKIVTLDGEYTILEGREVQPVIAICLAMEDVDEYFGQTGKPEGE